LLNVIDNSYSNNAFHGRQTHVEFYIHTASNNRLSCTTIPEYFLVSEEAW